MVRHHIIPKWEWKVRFGNLKGVHDPDNTVYLTLSQHAEVHLLLYELNHNDLDLQAHLACVGNILKRNKNKLHKNERRGRRLPKRSKIITPKKKRKSRTTYKKYRI